MHPEYQYLATINDILDNGTLVSNRTGVDTKRILGAMHKYDFKYGFPLFTTKKVFFKGVVAELLWFLKGYTNIHYLVENGVNIWTPDAFRFNKSLSGFCYESCDELSNAIANSPESRRYGELGPVYGKQWVEWDAGGKKINQIAEVIESIKTNPNSRRHIVSAWNVSDLDKMALPPCHVLFQFTLDNNKLWCHLYQRSADMGLGVPFNVASYSLLTYLIAKECGVEPGGFIHTIHDCHIYVNQIDALQNQLLRRPKGFPSVEIDDMSIWDIGINNIKLLNYHHHPAIKMKLSVG